MKPLNLLLLLLAVTCSALAQPKDLDKKLKGFDPFVAKVMNDWKVPGMAVAIVYKDKVVYAKGYGYRDVENKLPATAETLFAIGSCTKAFTAATVCLLQEDDKIELDKPVRTYLPTLTLADEYVSANITPRDLLCHRSGLPRHDFMWYGSSFSRKQLFDGLRHLEFNKPFRSTFQYQNLMFMTAGYLVEEMSGKTWEGFTRERILDPLAMKATNFSVAEMASANDRAIGYTENDEKVEVIPYRNIDAVGPAGSINSNVREMGNWITMLINGGKFGGKQVLSATTVREVQKPIITTPASIPLQYTENSYGMYGLGWFINTYRGSTRVEHGGNIDGFSASVCFLPYDSIGVVVLTNMNGTASPAIIRNNILDRMLGLSPIDWNKRLLDEVKKAKDTNKNLKKDEDGTRVKDTSPSHVLKDYTGSFSHPAYGTLTISIERDSLLADFHGLTSIFRHYHYDVFEGVGKPYFTGQKINFLTNLAGEIDRLEVKIEPAVKDIVFSRVPELKEVETSVLESYAGEYDFGGMVAKVFIKGESTLTLFVPGQPEYELVPVKEHEFKIKILDGFTIKFDVDTSGKVAELISIQPNGTFRARRKG